MGTTPNFHPTYHGFDEWLGLPYSDDMGCVDVPWPNLPMDPTCARGPLDDAHGDAAPKWPLPLYNSTGPNCSGQTSGNCNADILEQPANLETLAERYAAHAAGFLERMAASKQPFLLYAAFAHMHVPQFCNDAYSGKTGQGHFNDALAELDDTIGSIMQSLETNGLRSNTLVLVTGDNGPWEVKCNLT
jgi:arylsulfatase G